MSKPVCYSYRGRTQVAIHEYFTFNNYDQKKSWLIGCMEEKEVKGKGPKLKILAEKKQSNTRL